MALPKNQAEPLLLVTAPEVLSALEQSGLSFAQQVLKRPDGPLSALKSAPRLRSLEALLQRDLSTLQKNDALAGVGMRFSHRLFDLNWLSSSHARFELIAIVNRLDRAVFAPEHCGETRLVYRLAYQTPKVTSRLPMTLNVVYFQPRSADSDAQPCLAAAQRWQQGESTEALAAALRGADGPLTAALLNDGNFKSLELDVQSVRWPSTTRPDMGGHAQYLLRVLEARGDGWLPSPLENTPRERLSAEERGDLRAWIVDNLEAIDAGTARMPDAFADTESVGVTPLGLGRRGNRPFRRLFLPEDFSTLELTRFVNIASPEALLRRLDGMSCAGCHQTRSVAGFHLLGEDPADKQLDALLVPSSPHLLGELPRRLAFTRALLASEIPDPARPHSDHEPSAGAFGSHCGLGDPGFSAFQCAAGLRCENHGDPVMGTCVKDEPGAGGACEVGTLYTHNNPLRDRVQALKQTSCGQGVCNDNRVGFPQGMCATSCSQLRADEGCGAIVALRPFNDCIARGEPFPECMARTAGPAGLRACSAEAPCRDDYICTRARQQGGVCIPPYFLFQLRVDGHVVPR